MKLLSQRLEWAKSEKEARDGEKYSWAHLGRIAGVSAAAVSLWKGDANGIDSQYARPLASFLGVDPVWLETGEGDPSRSGRKTAQFSGDLSDLVSGSQIAELVSLFVMSTEIGRQQLLDLAHITPKRRDSGSAGIVAADNDA